MGRSLFKYTEMFRNLLCFKAFLWPDSEILMGGKKMAEREGFLPKAPVFCFKFASN